MSHFSALKHKMYYFLRYAKLTQGFHTDSSDEQIEEETEYENEENIIQQDENYDFDSGEKKKLCD